jgi:AP-4 complex subunit sigma-1
MIEFFLIVNKQGQTRFSKYFEHFDLNERIEMEGEIVRRCVTTQENFVCLFLFFVFFIFCSYSALFSHLENIKSFIEDMHHFILLLVAHLMRFGVFKLRLCINVI